MGGRLSLRHCPTRAGGNAVRVVIMEHIPTPSSTVGPFLHLGLTEKHSITHIAGPKVKGEHIILRCRIFEADGSPVSDGRSALWPGDSEGRCGHPAAPRSNGCDRGFLCSGRT